MKCIKSEKLSDTLTISECNTNSEYLGAFWLYDYTRGMYLAMGEVSCEKALLKALDYYQKRLKQFEIDYKTLNEKVEHFIKQINGPDDNEQ
jgi:hypothetical protein